MSNPVIIDEINIENKEIGQVDKKIERKRIYYLDILRLMAIVAVVTAHATSGPIVRMDFIGTEHWLIANAINGALRWAIPIFFMISGALLLNSKKDEDIGLFYKKSAKKLMIPLLTWSLIYFVFKYYVWIDFAPSDPASMIGVFFKELLFGEIYDHLWFMYTIIAMYFIMPFIRKMVQNLTKKELLIILWGWIFISFIYPEIGSLYASKTGQVLYMRILDIPLLMGYIGYFILGYYLQKYEVKKVTKYILYVLGFISAATISAVVYLMSVDSMTLNEKYYEHFSIFCLFMGAALFIYIKNVSWDEILNVKMKKVVASLSNATFGIYFSHLIVSRTVLNSMTVNFYKDSIIVIPMYLLFLVASIFLCYVFIKVVGLSSKLRTLLVG